jgi:hypothetical protein
MLGSFTRGSHAGENGGCSHRRKLRTPEKSVLPAKREMVATVSSSGAPFVSR